MIQTQIRENKDLKHKQEVIIMEEKMIYVFGLIALIVVAGIFYTMGEKQIIVSYDNTNKISVSGSAEKEVMPDEAILMLSVITEGKEAKQVQDENSVNMNNVIEALKAEGIDKKDIETTSYYLYPMQEYDYEQKKTIDKGYRLTNTIKVTTSDVENAGKLLDIAVKNGANQVENVYFQLSEDKEKEVKSELVAEATKNAKEKAETLASNLGASVGKPISISESSYYPPIYYAKGVAMMAETAASAPSPQINPESIKVTLTVNVDFSIE